MLNNQEIKPPVLIEDLGRLYPTVNSKQKTRYAIYKCFCGNEFKSSVNNVKRGLKLYCGCYKPNLGTHGLTNHRLYGIWSHIKRRVFHKDEPCFDRYGGRGISMCDEWKNDFKVFYDWSISNGYEDNLSIDRINNDGNYEPDNCRWSDDFTQTRNTRVLRSTNKSGYRGVSFNKRYKKWMSCIRFNGKTKHLGYFENAIDGAIAYNNFVIENKMENSLNPL